MSTGTQSLERHSPAYPDFPEAEYALRWGRARALMGKAGIDALFITAGIHAEELGDRSDPDAATLSSIFAAAGVAPKAVMHRLRW